MLLDILALMAVGAAVLVITARSPIVAVLYLIAVFVLAACYLMSLGVGFIGLSYLIVYVGAVAVLFLFVVMMLNVRLSDIVSAGREYSAGLPLGLIVGTLFLFELLSVVPAAGTQAGELSLNLLARANALLLGVDSAASSGTDVHLAFMTVPADVSFSVLSQVQALGVSLYTYSALWLMLVSIILLLAMMGPIALCMRSHGKQAI